MNEISNALHLQLRAYVLIMLMLFVKAMEPDEAISR